MSIQVERLWQKAELSEEEVLALAYGELRASRHEHE
jgi:hypothetical protein